MKKLFQLKSLTRMHLNNIPEFSLTTGLVLHLDASNPASYPGTGNIWYDLSPSGVNATHIGSPLFSTVNGGCFIDNVLSLGDPSILRFGVGDFTLSAWVNPSTTVYGINNQGTILSKFYPSVGVEMMIYQGISNFYTGSNTLQSHTMGINTNQWYLLTLRRVGTEIKLFQNTTFIGPGNNSAPISDVSNIGRDWRIGERIGQAGTTFAGKIAAVYMHNIALSDFDIVSLFNETKTRFGL